jgi:hypothetical protein
MNREELHRAISQRGCVQAENMMVLWDRIDSLEAKLAKHTDNFRAHEPIKLTRKCSKCGCTDIQDGVAKGGPPVSFCPQCESRWPLPTPPLPPLV